MADLKRRHRMVVEVTFPEYLTDREAVHKLREILNDPAIADQLRAKKLENIDTKSINKYMEQSYYNNAADEFIRRAVAAMKAGHFHSKRS